MTPEAKYASVARLKKAMEIEKLSTKDTAGFLGLNPNYISMLLNKNLWKSLPAYAWERLFAWCNSGSTLRLWKVPEGMSIYHKPEKTDPVKEEPLIKVKPEALEARKKVLKEREGKSETKSEEIKPEPDQLKPEEKSQEPEKEVVKSGEYVDVVDLLRKVAEGLPKNVKVVITINGE